MPAKQLKGWETKTYKRKEKKKSEKWFHILRNATRKSLVLMDEVGRGTSPKEGIAIAKGIVRYLHEKTKCRTLFSTHFFEICENEDSLEKFKNYHLEVDEISEEGLAFKHKVKPGKCTHSHGMFIAKVAKIPEEALIYAREAWESSEKV